MLRRAALHAVIARLTAMAGRDLELAALELLSPAELDILAERESYFT